MLSNAHRRIKGSASKSDCTVLAVIQVVYQLVLKLSGNGERWDSDVLITGNRV